MIYEILYECDVSLRHDNNMSVSLGSKTLKYTATYFQLRPNFNFFFLFSPADQPSLPSLFKGRIRVNSIQFNTIQLLY